MVVVSATVFRVSGSLVELEGLPGVAMYDVVLLGRNKLPGEVVAITGRRITVQAYEDTGGLAPGAPVVSRGAPLSARLGPGLLGSVFDGLLRSLSRAGTWLLPGSARDDATDQRWHFTPSVAEGATVSPGDELGTAGHDTHLPSRILVPADAAGVVDFAAEAGTYTADAVVATIAGVDVPLTTTWPVRRPRPYRRRLDAAEGLHTGQRVLDLLYPVARGSSAAVPGGFGTGKTMLLQQIAKWCDADVIVYVGCGERGNEMADVVEELGALEDPRTGDRLSFRTVVIANTSNMPMMAREASIYTGVTVAEYFRDMGYHVVLIADSTTRWAEALREFASRTGALPVEEGYPAGLASAMAAFYERAGHVVTLGGRTGSVTIIGAVSPQGGDMTEPVTAHTQRFVRSVWMLDRDLAYARHYPAVAWSGSFSRDAGALGSSHARNGDPSWARHRERVSALLSDADRLNALADLVGIGAMPGSERVVMLAGRLLREGVLQQSALSPNDAFCSAAKGAALLDAVLTVVDRCDAMVDSGVPATTIEETDFGPLLRAAQETGPDDVQGVQEHLDAMLARLGELG
ncbi:V-type ATP synthase subunit A [Rhodococcus sp. 14C212]|uniref:V-type ATP synthase subunit A n=1 Tax=Rhodococcus sp. 14C212 TaxID=2711209 RepID=UPI0013EA016C|nr:V-type ATP synthase subunit A [Rhodococcus sp. 14C212]